MINDMLNKLYFYMGDAFLIPKTTYSYNDELQPLGQLLNVSSANIHASKRVLDIKQIYEDLQNRYTWPNSYIIIHLQVILIIWVSENEVGQDKRNDAILTNNGCLLHVRNPLHIISVSKITAVRCCFRIHCTGDETCPSSHSQQQQKKYTKPGSLISDNILNHNLIWEICRTITKIGVGRRAFRTEIKCLQRILQIQEELY